MLMLEENAVKQLLSTVLESHPYFFSTLGLVVKGSPRRSLNFQKLRLINITATSKNSQQVFQVNVPLFETK